MRCPAVGFETAISVAAVAWALVGVAWLTARPPSVDVLGLAAFGPRICSSVASHACALVDARYVCDVSGAPFSDGLLFHLPVAPVAARGAVLPPPPAVFRFEPQPDAMHQLGCAWHRLQIRYALADGTRVALDGPVDNFTAIWRITAEKTGPAAPHDVPIRVEFDVYWDWQRSFLLLSPVAQAIIDRICLFIAVVASLLAAALYVTSRGRVIRATPKAPAFSL